ncbi:MAG: hypothetical protein OXG27_14730 [Chloroflexi bacterium]|nr:hypothetical protein [Chloroflexota bacterium]
MGAVREGLEVAGQRIHGASRRRPLEVFEREERSARSPWDGAPDEPADWRSAKVHPDHHIACQYALYSVPAALCPPGPCSSSGMTASSAVLTGPAITR